MARLVAASIGVDANARKSLCFFTVLAKIMFQAAPPAWTSLKENCSQACKLSVCKALDLRLKLAQADGASAAASNKLLYTLTILGHCAPVYKGNWSKNKYYCICPSLNKQ